MANSNMTLNDILSGWVSAESYDKASAFAYTSKAEVDKAITHLAASAIKLTLDNVVAGKIGDAREANILLYYANAYKKAEAVLLRAYLIHFGPFVAKPEAAQVLRKGEAPLIVYSAVKWSQKKYEASFKDKDTEQVAREVKGVDFATWKKVKKAAEKAEGKSEEDLKKEKTDAIKKRIERALKDAKDADIAQSELGLPNKTEMKTEVKTEVVQPSTMEELLAIIINYAAKPSLSPAERLLVTSFMKSLSELIGEKKAA